MTVQELLDRLESIPNKSMKVKILNTEYSEYSEYEDIEDIIFVDDTDKEFCALSP